MDLQKKSYTELQELFQKVLSDWLRTNSKIEIVKKRECEKYSEFAQSRAVLRHLSRESARLHNILVRIDLEMQIRVWTGKND